MPPTQNKALSPGEREDLERLEALVRPARQAFGVARDALAEVRDRKLFREHYVGFDDYLRERWDLDPSGRSQDESMCLPGRASRPRGVAGAVVTGVGIRGALSPACVELFDRDVRFGRELAAAAGRLAKTYPGPFAAEFLRTVATLDPRHWKLCASCNGHGRAGGGCTSCAGRGYVKS